jgi:HD-GYP domain-containing protein (c-di-GMP phosphodiesterase class II)
MRHHSSRAAVAADRGGRAFACHLYRSASSLANEAATAEPASRVDELLASRSLNGNAAVVIVDDSMLDRVDQLRQLDRHVVLVAADARAESALGERASISVVGISSPAARDRLLTAACELSCARLSAKRGRRRLARMQRELRELNKVGMSLMMERDQDLLLDQILQVGKRVTESDGGALLLARADGNGPPALSVAHVDFDTIQDFEIDVRTLAIDDASIVGHAAKTKKPIVIADAYSLPADASFVMNPAFDSDYRYRRRSMLIVPMTDHRDQLVGVLLFVNRKSDPRARITSKEAADRYVLPYTAREVQLARSLASQAAISIENSRLYARIEQTLESFVKASVTAIDQRDPTTAGHSLRVAALSVGLADAIERAGGGRYRHMRFTRKQLRELRFAALLHDFGKVAVREEVLIKAKKLPPLLWERIDARFDLIRRTLELEYCKARSSEGGTELTAALDQLRHMREIVRAANEPRVLQREPTPELADIARRTFRRPDGTLTPYLSPEELQYLRLPQGTLDENERAEIESHVEETYQFLNKIPWTDDLRNVAEYAYGHHEKLNGTGYPRRLVGDEIPVQTRIITLADIFDALTESDRPYKASVPPEKALDILRDEAKKGLLDAELVQILLESESYRQILEEDWRTF